MVTVRRRARLCLCLCLCFLFLGEVVGRGRTTPKKAGSFNVMDFGAIGDGVAEDTKV